jgi:hypothetical protein
VSQWRIRYRRENLKSSLRQRRDSKHTKKIEEREKVPSERERKRETKKEKERGRGKAIEDTHKQAKRTSRYHVSSESLPPS